jgi:ribosomal protein L11 methylase PrmA
MLEQMRRWIGRLQPRGTGPTVWSEYDHTHTYGSEEEQAKHAFIAAFIERARPGTVWDIGCNTGEYSETALRAGAGRVIGFDADHGALEGAFARARSRSLELTPLHLDAANPSPDQGWYGAERKSLNARANADAVLALAFIHHLAIGRNVPLPDVVRWLVELAPRGIIEFVQKTDPTVRRMLALREDIFTGYTEEAFVAALGQHGRIVETKTISAAGRRLYAYERA